MYTVIGILILGLILFAYLCELAKEDPTARKCTECVPGYTVLIDDDLRKCTDCYREFDKNNKKFS